MRARKLNICYLIPSTKYYILNTMAVFFALLTLIGWGVGDVFVTIASRRVGNLTTLFWAQIFSLILVSPYIPFAGGLPEPFMFLFAILLGLFVAWGTLLYFKGLEIGNAQLVGTIAGSFVLPVVLLSILLFGERLSQLQIVGIVTVLLGLILSSFDFRQIRSKKLQEIFSDPGIKYALLAMVVWGIYYAVIRIPAEKIGWFWAGIPAFFFFILLILLGKVNKNTLLVFKDRKALLAIIFFTLFITMAQFAYNLGILAGFTSIVAPIAGSYPVLFVILARSVFKEKLTRQQALGIVSSLVGIVLISSSV